VATLQEQRTTIEREEGELRQALAAGEERVTEERRAFLLLGQELARREQELSQRDITRGKLREEQRMMEEKRRALKQGAEKSSDADETSWSDYSSSIMSVRPSCDGSRNAMT